MCAKKIFKSLKLLPEAFVIIGLYLVLRLLPLDKATTICAKIAKSLGPKLKVSHVARENLKHAFPHKTTDEIEIIVKGCWENLGRVVGEFPHIPQIISDLSRVEIVNEDILKSCYHSQKPCVFIAAHLGNWELSYAPLALNNYPIHLIARVHQNPLIEKFLSFARHTPFVKMLTRNAVGSKSLIKLMKEKKHIGALLDQHASDGIMLPLFGRPARTSTALARLCYKYDGLFIPVQVERLNKKSHFRITFHPPLTTASHLDPQEAGLDMMKQANQYFEEWISQRPEQWLWLHKRWKNKKAPSLESDSIL
jgi:KDO2-lipid IV(A) lauroyltransferase